MKEVLRTTFNSTRNPNISAAAAQAYLAAAIGHTHVDPHGHAFRLAEFEGNIAGLVHWRQHNVIQALHVWPPCARRGITGRLMDVIERAVAAAGLPSVRLETDTFDDGRRAFYATRDHAEAGRYPDEEWNSGLTTILLLEQPG